MSTNTNKEVNLKLIQKAEQFLMENCLFSIFYLFCGEIREKGIKEKWDHTARWEAISRWVSEQDTTAINPFNEKPQNVEGALTEWYEKIYLPSKWTGNSGYKKNYKGKGEGQKENSESKTE